MAKETKLRFAEDYEIPKLEKLLAQDTKSSIEVLRNGSESLGEVVLVVEYDHEYAGFLTYRRNAQEIFPLVIFYPYRGLGIGFSAVQQFVDMLREEGISSVMIDVVEGAERFWEKAFEGYVVENVVGPKFKVYL